MGILVHAPSLVFHNSHHHAYFNQRSSLEVCEQFLERTGSLFRLSRILHQILLLPHYFSRSNVQFAALKLLLDVAPCRVQAFSIQ